MARNPRQPKTIAALSLTLGGIASGFAAASCCALPMLLASAGIGSAWLGGIAVPAAPYRVWFLAFGAVSLLAGALLLGRQQARAMRCGTDGTCVPAAVRLFTLAGLLIGVVLLWLGYRYA